MNTIDHGKSTLSRYTSRSSLVRWCSTHVSCCERGYHQSAARQFDLRATLSSATVDFSIFLRSLAACGALLVAGCAKTQTPANATRHRKMDLIDPARSANAARKKLKILSRPTRRGRSRTPGTHRHASGDQEGLLRTHHRLPRQSTGAILPDRS